MQKPLQCMKCLKNLGLLQSENLLESVSDSKQVKDTTSEEDCNLLLLEIWVLH